MNNDPGFTGFVALITFILTVVSLEPAIYPYSIEYAKTVCENNGGWEKIEEGYSLFSSVKCNNGAEFEYERLQLELAKKEEVIK